MKPGYNNEFGFPDWWWQKKVQWEGRQLSRTEWHLARTYGLRGDEGTGKKLDAILDANELGYLCPKGHLHVCWSEFKEHIWCKICKLDILSRKCKVQRPSYAEQKKFDEWVKSLPFEIEVLPGIRSMKDIGE